MGTDRGGGGGGGNEGANLFWQAASSAAFSTGSPKPYVQTPPTSQASPTSSGESSASYSDTTKEQDSSCEGGVEGSCVASLPEELKSAAHGGGDAEDQDEDDLLSIVIAALLLATTAWAIYLILGPSSSAGRAAMKRLLAERGVSEAEIRSCTERQHLEDLFWAKQAELSSTVVVL